MKTHTLLAGLLLFVPCTVFASSIDTTFNATFDTGSIAGTGSYELALLLTDGSGVGDRNTTVQFLNFQFGSGGAAGDVTGDSTGGVSGSLGSGVSLVDSSFFNLFGSDFQPGSTLAFQTQITSTSLDSPTPDLIQVVILDAAGSPLATSDPTGQDSLFIEDLNSSNPTPQSYALLSTPEPASAGLCLCGIVLAGVFARKRGQTS